MRTRKRLMLGAAFVVVAAVALAQPKAPESEAQRVYAQAEKQYDNSDLEQSALAEPLFLKADDLARQGQALKEDCARFRHGIGVDVDAKRAFDCATRQQETFLLAHYYATGGPVPKNPGKAIELLQHYLDQPGRKPGKSGDDREQKQSVEKIVAELRAGKTPEIEECMQDGTDCSIHRFRVAEATVERLSMKAMAGLDGAGKAALKKWGDAFDAYSQAHAQYRTDHSDARERMMENSGMEYEQMELMKVEIKKLAAFSEYRPSLNDGDLKAAEAKLKEAYESELASIQPKEEKEEGAEEEDPPADHPASQEGLPDSLQKAQQAWITYRDAEAAFYVQAFGGKYGGAQVATDVKAKETKRRVDEF